MGGASLSWWLRGGAQSLLEGGSEVAGKYSATKRPKKAKPRKKPKN